MSPIPMDADILNRILHDFSNIFNNGVKCLTPSANKLILLLAAVDLVLIFLLNLTYINHIKILIQKTLIYSFFIFIVANFKQILSVFLTGVVWLGLVAGGVDKPSNQKIQEISNPTAIVAVGINLAEQIFNPLLETLKVVTGYNAGGIFFMKALVAFLIFLCFAIMGIQIFITYIEFYITGTVALILIPFGVNKHTSFIGEKAIGAMVSFGIKLMVLTFIATAIMQIAPNFKINDTGFLDMNSMNQCFYALTGSLALMILTWHAPNIVSGLMTGSPTLTAGTAINPLVQAATQLTTWAALKSAAPATASASTAAEGASATGATGGEVARPVPSRGDLVATGGSRPNCEDYSATNEQLRARYEKRMGIQHSDNSVNKSKGSVIDVEAKVSSDSPSMGNKEVAATSSNNDSNSSSSNPSNSSSSGSNGNQG